MQGHQAAQEFERLVREHHAAVYRTAFSILRRDDQALDVAQQVFLRVLEGRERLEQADDPERVLRWVAARQALMLQRAQGVRREKERGETMGEAHSSEAELEASEAREVLAVLVAGLSEPLRNAIVLRFQEERTFAEIGRLVGAAESTVHDRVAQALGELRAKLSRMGFAALVPGLEQSLSSPEPIAIPAGLEAKLCTLAATTPPALTAVAGAGGAAWSWFAGVGALLLALVAALATPWRGAEESPLAELGSQPAVEAAALAAPAVVPGREAAPADAAPAESPVARALGAVAAVVQSDGKRWIEGRIVDADGRGLSDVEVRVLPSDTKGGWDWFGDPVKTDADGRFRWEGGAGVPAGRGFDLRARLADFIPVERVDLSIEAGKVLALGDLTMQRDSDDRDGEYELVIALSDPDGRPVAGAIARLFRDVRQADGKSRSVQEAHGQSDAGGILSLRGKKLGKKLLKLDARKCGLRCDPIEWTLDAPGVSRREVTLVRGLVIAGRLRGPDGGPPPRIYVFQATVPPSLEGHDAEIDAHGAFRFPGLDPGKYTLRCSASECSTFQLDGVVAGREDLDLSLKRFDEPRDVGLHRGEIHGIVVDRRTGKELAVKPGGAQLRWVEAATDEELRLDELPVRLAPAQYQTMTDGSPPPPPRADFHFGDLDAGAYVVRVEVPGIGLGFSRRIEVGRDELVTQVRVEVGPGVLAGIVLDGAGRPVAAAKVIVTGMGTRSKASLEAFDAAVQSRQPDRLRGFGGYVTSAADGSFVIENLPADLHFRLAAAAPGMAMAVSEPLAPEAEAGVRRELRLVPRGDR